MSLDKLFSILKKVDYPLRDRVDVMRVIGKELIIFDGHVMDAGEIAVHLEGYPIKSVSDFFKKFIKQESESYDLNEAKSLGAFEARIEQ